MTWNLKRARLQFWMDMTNILSVTPWAAKPDFEEGVDRPVPLLYVINGGEDQAKLMQKKQNYGILFRTGLWNQRSKGGPVKH